MNDDFTELERELRRLRPVQPSARLEDGLLLALSSRPERRRSWRQRSDFLRLAAAFAWSIAAAAAIAVMAAGIGRYLPGAERRPPAQPGARTARTDPLAEGLESAQASNVLYETRDEGVVYTSAQQPARRLRYRSEDTLTWRNPRTGAQLEVSYPREEVVLVPIAMH